jgi:peptidoglycan hydrolase-like protein with peptidoglycan-binding domain
MQTTDKQVTISDHIKQPLLQQGSTGLAVAELQTLLKTRGFYPDDIDGIFSPTVKKAVISFQPTFRRSLSKVDNIGDKLAQGSEESIFVHH